MRSDADQEAYHLNRSCRRTHSSKLHMLPSYASHMVSSFREPQNFKCDLIWLNLHCLNKKAFKRVPLTHLKLSVLSLLRSKIKSQVFLGDLEERYSALCPSLICSYSESESQTRFPHCLLLPAPSPRPLFCNVLLKHASAGGRVWTRATR